MTDDTAWDRAEQQLHARDWHDWKTCPCANCDVFRTREATNRATAEGLNALAVNEYSVRGGDPMGVEPYETVIVRRRQIGSSLWAVKRGAYVLNVSGEWEDEPQPSSRDDEFIRRCRFKTAEAALAAFRAFRESR